MNALRALALVAMVTLSGLSVAHAGAQTAPVEQPSIDAVGYGTSSAPVEEATLQFLLISNQGYGMGMGMMDEPASMPGEGTPVSVMPPMEGMGMPPLMTEEALQPIVDTLVAGGVSDSDITVTVPATPSMFGPGGPELGEVRATVRQPAGDQLPPLVQSVYDAARGAGLQLFHVGARYEPADCASLLQSAREAAIADARARAEGLAEGLGVELGELIKASEPGAFGYPPAGSCLPADMAASMGMYGPGTENAFDPRVTEAMVSVQVVLTFALGPAL